MLPVSESRVHAIFSPEASVLELRFVVNTTSIKAPEHCLLWRQSRGRWQACAGRSGLAAWSENPPSMESPPVCFSYLSNLSCGLILSSGQIRL